MLVGVSHPPVDGEDDYRAAQAAWHVIWRRLLTSIRATRDPQERFDRATETGEHLPKMTSEVAAERADAALGIQAAEDLSLTELGGRISTTRQGAWRLTSKARQKEQR